MIEVGTIIDSMYKVEKILGSGSQGIILHVKTISSKISILREFDLKSKGLGANNTSNSDILKELIFKLLH